MTAHPPSDPAAEAEIALRNTPETAALATALHQLAATVRLHVAVTPSAVINAMSDVVEALQPIAVERSSLLADIAALRTRAENAESERDEHEMRADSLERERRLMDARVHHQRTALREVDATACRIKELERDRGRAWAKACARKADLLALARRYGEACGALAEYRSAGVEWQGEQAEYNAAAEAACDTLATDLAKARAEVARLTAALKPFAALSFSFDGFSAEPAALVFRGGEHGQWRCSDRAAFQKIIDAAERALKSDGETSHDAA